MTGSTYAPPPHRFEAGTPPIAQAVGLGAAARYLCEIGMDADRRARAGDHRVRAGGPARTPGAADPRPDASRSTGAGRSRSPCDRRRDADPSRTTSASCWTRRGIAVRGGHHCARPLHERFGVQSSTRASFYLYTTNAEIDALVDGLDYVQRLLRRWHDEGRGALPGDHPGSLPGQAPQRSAGAVRGRGAPRQPELRRRGDPADPLDGGIVSDVSYEGLGCSISQASTSVMSDLVIGQTIDHGLALHEEFLALMQSGARSSRTRIGWRTASPSPAWPGSRPG